jgi:hypothetical protein
MYRATFAVLIALVVAGCQQAQSPSENGEADKTSTQKEFSATIGGEHLDSPQPVVFSVLFPSGKEPQGDLSMSVSDELSLVVQGPYSAFKARSLEVDLSNPDQEGLIGTLVLAGGVVTSGKVVLTFRDDGVAGTFPEGDLAFDGTLVVSCAVATAGQGAGVAADDPEFSSPECASVKADGF